LIKQGLLFSIQPSHSPLSDGVNQRIVLNKPQPMSEKMSVKMIYEKMKLEVVDKIQEEQNRRRGIPLNMKLMKWKF